jgi:hypothetical protein
VGYSLFLGFGSRNSAPASYTDIDYAAYIQGHVLYLFERGLCIGGSTVFSADSIIELRVSDTQVQYIVNGDLKYVSNLRGEAELFAMASFPFPGSEALEIQWL